MNAVQEDALRRHLAERAQAFGSGEDLHRIADGDFSAIPADLRWETSADVAHLINGYDLSPAAGLGDCGEFANTRAVRANDLGWSGDVLELWLCLFFEHRRYRHMGYDPVGRELMKLDALFAAISREARSTA